MIYVVGVPAPQGSKSAFVRNGRAVVVEGSSTTGREKQKAWRTAVTLAAIEWRHNNDIDPITGPIAVTINFSMPRPKSAPVSARWASKKPDLDKLVRSTLDGLTDAGVWHDDAQVVELLARKNLKPIDGVTGAVITIREPQ